MGGDVRPRQHDRPSTPTTSWPRTRSRCRAPTRTSTTTVRSGFPTTRRTPAGGPTPTTSSPPRSSRCRRRASHPVAALAERRGGAGRLTLEVLGRCCCSWCCFGGAAAPPPPPRPALDLAVSGARSRRGMRSVIVPSAISAAKPTVSGQRGVGVDRQRDVLGHRAELDRVDDLGDQLPGPDADDPAAEHPPRSRARARAWSALVAPQRQRPSRGRPREHRRLVGDAAALAARSR